jgi:hypothetical protein
MAWNMAAHASRDLVIAQLRPGDDGAGSGKIAAAPAGSTRAAAERAVQPAVAR